MSNFRVTYSVDGVPLDDAAGRWLLGAGSGRRSLPAVRVTNVSTPGRHGSVFVPNDSYDDTQFGLTVVVTDKDSAGVRGGAVQAEKNLELLTALMAGTGRLLLVEQYTGPTEKRTAYGRVTAGSEPEVFTAYGTEYRLHFVVEVPGVFWSDGAGPQFMAGAAPTASGTLHLPILDGGSAPVTDAVIRFAGPFNGLVSVSDVGGGATYAWSGTPDASTSTMSTAAGTVTNLATNPSFEATSGTVEVWRNLHHNPSYRTGGVGLSGTGATFTLGQSAGGVDGVKVDITSESGITNYDSGGALAEVGAYYAARFTIVALNEFTAGKELRMRTDNGLTLTNTVYATFGAVGEPVVVNLPASNAATTTGIIRTYTYGLRTGGNVGASFLRGAVTVQKVSGPGQTVSGPTFDGSYSPDPDLVPSWTGAVNNSPSVLTGRTVSRTGASGTFAFVYQSDQWKKSGLASVLINGQKSTGKPEAVVADHTTNYQLQLLPGKTYTALGVLRLTEPGTQVLNSQRKMNFYYSINAGASYVEEKSEVAPNIAGEYSFRFTFTVPVNADRIILRLGGNGQGSMAWWDNLAIVEGEYTGGYFDGSTPSTVSPHPTGLSYQGNVPAGQYVFLNADTLRAHTSTNKEAWDTGTDVSGNLDYPPAGPLQITPAALSDGTHYAVAYTLPAAKNTPDAVAVRAERKFI